MFAAARAAEAEPADAEPLAPWADAAEALVPPADFAPGVGAQDGETGRIEVAYPDATTPGGRLELPALLVLDASGVVAQVEVASDGALARFGSAVERAFVGAVLPSSMTGIGREGLTGPQRQCIVVTFDESVGRPRWTVQAPARLRAQRC